MASYDGKFAVIVAWQPVRDAIETHEKFFSPRKIALTVGVLSPC